MVYFPTPIQDLMDETKTYPLTIAYDAKRAYLNYRGLGNYCRNLLAQMAHYYGDNRYLLCTPQDKGLYSWLNESPFEHVMPGGLWSMVPSVWRRYGIPSALADRQVDIYHGLSQELPEGIEQLGCKTVVTMHDAIFLRYPELYSATYRRSFIRRNASACRRADKIVAISEQTKRDYMDFFGVEESRISVVYQGCNEVFWQPVSEAEMQRVSTTFRLPEAYILCVGALEERKNQLRLIEAAASTQTSLPIVLVGRGNRDYKQRLMQTARQYDVPLRLIEDAGMQDLPAIYRLASVFAYPSLFEGFGIPILEAVRCGVPVVASSGTCFEEIAGEGVVYAPPTEPEAIGEAIRTTLLNREETQQRVALALRNTEKFRAEHIAHNMMQVYQTVCR